MRRFLLGAAALSLATVCADDLEWKWDVSGHVEASPAAGEASIAGVLPYTAAAVNGSQAHTHVYDWLDSDGFNFDGQAPGMFMILR